METNTREATAKYNLFMGSKSTFCLEIKIEIREYNKTFWFELL